ncbi:TPA: DeoR/GlpR family DNA-binding transcription regulator [Streptococcus agalactiae]
MLKRERLQKIIEKVNINGIVTVNEIMEELDVSDMTVRRDLDELDKAGLLIRIHGGAQKVNASPTPQNYEKSNTEKYDIQTNEKLEIAQFAKQFINDGETIFIGPGTPLEKLATQLLDFKIRIVTNSLPVFNILNQSSTLDLILVGGEYREITGAFVGSVTINSIKSLNFSKAFVSSNGVFEKSIATYDEGEGEIQRIALNNSFEKFLLVDSQKFGKYDFYTFYQLDDIDFVLTDHNIDNVVKEQYSSFTKILTNNNYM